MLVVTVSFVYICRITPHRNIPHIHNVCVNVWVSFVPLLVRHLSMLLSFSSSSPSSSSSSSYLSESLQLPLMDKMTTERDVKNKGHSDRKRVFFKCMRVSVSVCNHTHQTITQTNKYSSHPDRINHHAYAPGRTKVLVLRAIHKICGTLSKCKAA